MLQQGRVGPAHNTQVDRPQGDLREDTGEDGRDLEHGVQKARDRTGEHTGEHRGDNRDEGVDTGDYEHSADASAECEAAVNRKVRDIEQLVGDEHTKDHDAPENALGDGAE